MEKTIEQLLELSQNQYYTFTNAEQKRLDDFLSLKSARKSQAPKNTEDLEKNIPATAVNKNKVNKETGELPVVEYGEISQELAEEPATGNNPTEGA